MKYLRFTGSGLGVLIALALFVGFGAWRYDGFIGAYNILTVLRYNSMFAFVRTRDVLRDHDGRHRPLGRFCRRDV